MEVDQQKSNSRDHSPVIQLLNQGDQLTQRFQKQFNDSITHVQTLNSSLQQHDNLSNLAARSGGMEINTQYPSVRQRTLATLTKTINEASGGIRSSLELMEATVDSLSELLYKVDIYLAEPASIGSIGFDPINALNHLETSLRHIKPNYSLNANSSSPLIAKKLPLRNSLGNGKFVIKSNP
ncbi:hypothetical protein Pst134EB_014483 [Puccinia striiformis f. sp. tritici]|nr:hypothetical protein Pst134EB_014483 [Puccinia striiformis f. sp. tritici]